MSNSERDRIEAILEREGRQPGALLPVLHAIRDELGHIPRPAVAQVAEALNLSRADVHGVVSFYHDFRHDPGPALRVCMGEACQSMGATALLASATERLGERCEAVYCLGLCACAPSVDLGGGDYRGRMSKEALEELLNQLSKEVAA